MDKHLETMQRRDFNYATDSQRQHLKASNPRRKCPKPCNEPRLTRCKDNIHNYAKTRKIPTLCKDIKHPKTGGNDKQKPNFNTKHNTKHNTSTSLTYESKTAP